MRRWFKQNPGLIGIEIDIHSVKLLELSQLDDHSHVKAYAIQPIAHKSPTCAAIAMAIQIAYSQLQTTTKQVAIAISDADIITRTIELDASLSSYEINQHILMDFERYMPYPADQSYFDFEIINVETNHQQVTVRLVAARRSVIDIYLQAIALAGLSVKIIDIESHAITRIVKKLPAFSFYEHAGLALAVLYISGGQMNLRVFAKQGLIFSRSEPCINSAADMESLAVQIERALRFYFADSHEMEIGELIVLGEILDLPSLILSLTKKFPITINQANPFVSMTTAQSIDVEQLSFVAGSLLVSCGLAMRAAVGANNDFS